MRFNVLVTASFFVTLAVGLIIPHNTLSSRDLEVRDGLGEDTADILVREPLDYHVPAGNGRPAQTYSHEDVTNAIRAANAERKRLKPLDSNHPDWSTSDLKTFNNHPHQLPMNGGPMRPLPSMKGTGFEYPLPNKSGNPWKGPARVILQMNRKGGFKFKGVVAHDQSRAHGTLGANDHFEVVGT